jgi:HAD superfamily hydrolase (TIGR01509 family)
VVKLSDFAAVIFDMDGLVLDTEPTYFIAWQQAAQMMGYKLPASFCESLSGLHYQAVTEAVLSYCGADFNLQRFNELSGHYWYEHVNRYGIHSRTGFNELIETLIQQDIPYCLATNSSAMNAKECLAFAKLDHVFSTIISRDEVLHGKPAPDIFLKAAAILNIPIQQCLVLEDSHAGIVAAKSAGAYALWIPATKTLDPVTLSLCDAKMNSLAELVNCKKHL